MRLTTASTALLTLLLLAAPALADMGPKPSYYGNTPRPFTDMPGIDVEMTAEVVNLTLRRGEAAGRWNRHRVPVFLDVVATFTMTNPADEAVSFETGFPVGAVPNHHDFTVAIDGEAAAATLRDLNPPAEENRGRDNHVSNYWYVWDGTYPPGESTHVVTYRVDLFSPTHEPRASYILHSGGPWAGPIGHAVVTLDFANGMTPDSLNHLGPVEGGTREGNRMRWEWRNLDPTDAHDIRIDAFSLRTWREAAAELRTNNRGFLYRMTGASYASRENQRHLRAELTPEEQREVADRLVDIDGLARFDSEGRFDVRRHAAGEWYSVLPRCLNQALGIARAHPYSEPIREALQFWIERAEEFRDGETLIDGRTPAANRHLANAREQAAQNVDAARAWLAGPAAPSADEAR